MAKHQLIISSCGNSLITNGASEQERKLITMYGTIINSSDIPINALKMLENMLSRVERKLLSSMPEQAASLSIEVNSIVRFYKTKIKDNKNDHHIFLSTDAWLSEKIANILAKWLMANQTPCQVYKHNGLSIDTIDSYQFALSELVSCCDELITPFRDKGYKIIFNLSAAPKSLQGFLQTLATFYADESFYIFEPTNQVLIFPSPPIEITQIKAFHNDIRLSRRLSLNLKVSSNQVGSIPEAFILKLKDSYALSPLGKLVWERNKKALYSERLWLPPTEKVKFSANFINTVEKLPSEQLVLINQTIDLLTKFLESNLPHITVHITKLLEVRPLQGTSKPSTHQLNSWINKDPKLILVHYDKDILVLDSIVDPTLRKIS